MLINPQAHVLSAVAAAAWPLAFSDHEADYSALVREIGNARLVLIGEASHGTHEFYRERARLTRMLIEQEGFNAVAVEADWPDAYRLNHYVRHSGGDANAEQALSGFRRFPAWMWRNMDVLAFTDWLRRRNARSQERVGFYGLDLYSMYTSAQEVVRYLEQVDPAAAARARYRYGCFEHFGEDSEAYGYAASFDMSESCEKQAVEQLTELVAHAARADGDEAEFFSAEQNARLVRDAEHYYRTMFGGRVNSWNVRDRHMGDTLCRLVEFLGPSSKVVVWAHNSHLGDARTTEMGRMGELNLGQLVREKYGDQSFLIGFTTHSGEVTAATNWGEAAERKIVRHALPGSYEALFHETGLGDFLLLLRRGEVREVLRQPRLERAIGVIYRPETERMSHYFEARLSEQFDAVIHIDRTRALIPLEKTVPWQRGEAFETYPTAV